MIAFGPDSREGCKFLSFMLVRIHYQEDSFTLIGIVVLYRKCHTSDYDEEQISDDIPNSVPNASDAASDIWHLDSSRS